MLRLVRSPINAFALGLGLVFSEVLHKLLLLDVCAHYCCTRVACSLVEITPAVFVVWSPPMYLREWGPWHFGWKLNSEDGGCLGEVWEKAKRRFTCLWGRPAGSKENCVWIFHIWNSNFLKTSDGETIKRTRWYVQLCNWKLFRLNSFMVPNTHFKNRWR